MKTIFHTFKIPVLILLGIAVTLLLRYVFHLDTLSVALNIAIVFFGSIELVGETIKSLFKRKFALDYIALLAITVAILGNQYIVAAIIVLMLSGGNTLEKFGMNKARASLSALTDRIPNTVSLWVDGAIGKQVALSEVCVGQQILVRKGEVVTLDGILVSPDGLTDESSLTGEPYIIEKIKGDHIRSGTVNVGNMIIVRVTKVDKDSTYRKIIQMVEAAQSEKSPLIRLADRYSTMFTALTLVLAALAYLVSHDFSRVLAVLVIATPCPLILATPIALMGGVNAAAKKRIIMKKLSSVEVLSRVNAIVFDKTGTITVGKPTVRVMHILDHRFDEKKIYAVTMAIERNSLHPLAKALVTEAQKKHAEILAAHEVEEVIGSGIKGIVEGTTYHLSKVKDATKMSIQLKSGEKPIALFEFEDQKKQGSRAIIKELKRLGLALYLFTGDKWESAEKVADELGVAINVQAECSPEDKKNGISKLKKEGKITAMIGDGINDAPALAAAHVGLVFSNDEHTASTEAADVVFLGGDFSSILHTIAISKYTVHIALQSIGVGMGLSVIGMIFATFGFIQPLTGAFAQEAIDIFVILNALRASRYIPFRTKRYT